MIHEMIPVGLLQCNCSVFGDEETREAFVIDPGDEVERIVDVLDRHRLHVTAIVITHGHIDHVLGAQKLRQQTGAPVYMNEADSVLLDMLPVQASWLGMETPERPEVDAPASDGLVLKLGAASAHVLHTPGHTPGSCSLWFPQQQTLVAGDTLFRDSIGRTDLPGGNARQLLSSIKTQLLSLPEESSVIPGHGPVTTIHREKERNPFLRGI